MRTRMMGFIRVLSVSLRVLRVMPFSFLDQAPGMET